ncbi:MAG: response regulator transcription factor [Eudoraea sp.]|nr:LytTR family DNA-binding domain-containing protein [Eudoraea sp.]NNJ39652.1 response regulator transcription factor [Eudoraea sp.]
MKKENPKLGTLILDHSATQRALLTHLAKQHPELELQGAYGDATTAHKRLGEVLVDLVILNIEMPVISGFNFIDTLDEYTQVIFVTASPQYALEAFDHGVTDYLLKPPTAKRFRQAVEKAVKKHQGSHKPLKSDLLVIRCDLQQREVNVAEILWVEAMGDYVKLITPSERVVVLSTMKAMTKKLPKDRFLRIHRSYIVNLGMVDKFNSTSVDIGGKTLPMSRSKKPVLEQMLYPMP